jgi:DNA invertase Pin-like site-specific DNA recombinase
VWVLRTTSIIATPIGAGVRWVLSTKRPWLLGLVVLQRYCNVDQCGVCLFHAKRRVLEHPPFLIHHGKIGAFNDRLHRNTTIRCGLYARISTSDGRQDTENQLSQLREYCQRQGYQVVQEYIDQASGKSSDRDAFKQLFDGASKRMFERVVVWALDRFTREGVLETFEHIRRLTSYGVAFESYTESHFRTTGPAGELMLAIAAWIAKQERIRILDRTKAGLARARRQGKVPGRPKRVFRRDEVVRLRDMERMSWRAIAAALDIPVMTAVDAYRRTEIVSAGAIIGDGSDSTSSAPNDAYAIGRERTDPDQG